MSALVWFRNDLRLQDQPALHAAMAAGKIIALFVLDDEAAGEWAWGGASRWWLHHSLASLDADLRARGGRLVLRRGDARRIVPEVAAAAQVDQVHAGRAHEPWLRAVDKDVAGQLKSRNIRFHRHLSALLLPPESIKTKAGGDYGVYTPFSRACFEVLTPAPLLPSPTRIEAAADLGSDRLEDWGLLPQRPDWAAGLRASWQPGEAGARQLLVRFVDGAIDEYDQRRNLPADRGTSALSPHLHWGEISPRAVWAAAVEKSQMRGVGLQTFLKELLWREFAAYLLWHHPDMAETPMKPAFAAFPWRDSPQDLRAWQRGQTGVPIVDAGMRQLWQTGWMHNRVRMIVASFLVKHLLLPWQLGEKWFWDTLVDADLASNAASWQWVAGCGADAAPYFRIFNPVLQGQKFDPDGTYLRRYVPEISGLSNKFIHAPWLAPKPPARSVYPSPIIDLDAGRARALDALKTISKSGT